MKNALTTSLIWLCLSLIVVPVPAAAATLRSSHDWCGTHPTGAEIAIARGELFERQRRQREDRLAAASRRHFGLTSAPQVMQQGDVVIIVDDGTIIQQPNEADISNKGVRFLDKRKKIKLVKKPGGINQGLGEQIFLGDDDSERIEFDTGFKFKFFGNTYTEAFVNSDGNITFGEADNASTARDLGRALNGPARVMPFFADFDPSVGGQVWVKFFGKRKMQVTWVNVPEWGGFQPNTFQVTLFKKGHVEIRFGEVDAAAGIVGISPGGSAAVELVDLTEDAPTKLDEQAIAEVFGTEEIVDESAVARTFYDHYPDDVDQIVLYYDFVLPLLGGGAVAYHFTVKNDVEGIGYKNFRSQETFDSSGALGSNGRLEGFANMGYVHKYNDNLNQLRDTLTHLGVLVHELGHQWLSRIFYRRSGETSTDLQEFGGHWSFVTDTDASFMQGNEIRDNDDGSFTTLEKDAVFSQMDKYMMGLIPPAEVPDFFWVDNSSADPGSLPEWGFTLRGDRVDVSVQDVIAEEGQRRPSSEDSRKEYRAAMVLLVPQDQQPNQPSIDKVQDFADLLVSRWPRETDGLMRWDVTVEPVQ